VRLVPEGLSGLPKTDRQALHALRLLGKQGAKRRKGASRGLRAQKSRIREAYK